LASGALKKGFRSGAIDAALDSNTVQRLQASLRGVRVVVIDEVSMLRAADLYDIHRRLCAGLGVENDIHKNPFAGLIVLFVGDCYQLPAMGRPLYD